MFRRIRENLRRTTGVSEPSQTPRAVPVNTNSVVVGENVNASIKINGDHNTIAINGADYPSTIKIIVSGDYNSVKIKRLYKLEKLNIRVGNHRPAYGAAVEIDEGLSVAENCDFFIYNSLNSLSIGKNCMFSRDIIIRCGESPHLIFDRSTAEYLDVSEGVVIGDHVWVGERAYITKRASIADESIVAACAVVTKKFTEDHVVLAGNPARVVRGNVQWLRNFRSLEEGSGLKKAFDNRQEYTKQEARRRYLLKLR